MSLSGRCIVIVGMLELEAEADAEAERPWCDCEGSKASNSSESASHSCSRDFDVDLSGGYISQSPVSPQGRRRHRGRADAKQVDNSIL